MPPPRVTGETGAFHFAKLEDIGSTRMTSRFIVLPSAGVDLAAEDSACRGWHASTTMEV
jgi:hypothetical protein